MKTEADKLVQNVVNAAFDCGQHGSGQEPEIDALPWLLVYTTSVKAKAELKEYIRKLEDNQVRKET